MTDQENSKGSQNEASTSNEPVSLTQVGIFAAFMRAVWGDGEDAPDYDTYCDAIRVAAAMGAKATGEGKTGDAGDGDNGSEWLFPDGTSVWIVTDAHGRGVGLVGPHGMPSVLP